MPLAALKIELFHLTRWRTRDEAERAIFEYIGAWYDTRVIPIATWVPCRLSGFVFQPSAALSVPAATLRQPGQ